MGDPYSAARDKLDAERRSAQERDAAKAAEAAAARRIVEAGRDEIIRIGQRAASELSAAGIPPTPIAVRSRRPFSSRPKYVPVHTDVGYWAIEFYDEVWILISRLGMHRPPEGAGVSLPGTRHDSYSVRRVSIEVSAEHKTPDRFELDQWFKPPSTYPRRDGFAVWADGPGERPYVGYASGKRYHWLDELVAEAVVTWIRDYKEDRERYCRPPNQWE